MIKCVLFDLDGTIVDSMWYWRHVHQQYIESLGINEKEDISQRTMAMTDHDACVMIKEKYNLAPSADEIDHDVCEIMRQNYQDKVVVKPGFIKLFEILKNMNIKMAICSSTEKSLILFALERFGIRNYFDVVLSSYEIGKPKSEPDIYIKASSMMGFKPEESMIMEDLPFGIISGNRAGFTTIGILDNNSLNHQETIQQNADIYVIDMSDESINAIVNVINQKIA